MVFLTGAWQVLPATMFRFGLDKIKSQMNLIIKVRRCEQCHFCDYTFPVAAHMQDRRRVNPLNS